ncbi:MAG: PAS domain S-box protein [Deltaproteobacteria bacterium]|nr:PAS domain S-box protein [Deltaproteobacteria bacterium]
MPHSSLDSALFRIVTEAQSSFASERDLPGLSRELVRSLLDLTGGGYGFLAALSYDGTGATMTPVASVRVGSSAPRGLRTAPAPLRLGASGLIVESIDARSYGISDGRTRAPDSRDLPAGSPPIANSVALPFPLGMAPIGVLFLANRRGGWDPRTIDSLRPALDTCANIFGASATEARLAEREAQTGAILDAVPDGIFSLDLRGRVASSNPAGEMIFDADGLTGQRLPDLLDPPSAALLDDTLAAARDGAGVPTSALTLTGVRSEGRSFPLELRLRAGGPGSLVAIVQDRSEQQRLEAERNRFFQLSPQILLTLDLNGSVRDMNPALTSVLGWQEQQVLSNSLLALAHPTDRALVGERVRQSREGDLTEPFRARFRKADGTYLWLEWRTTADTDAESIYCSGDDITARAESERTKSEFVSVVSHELRTPLTSIRGSLGLLAGGVGGELTAEQTQLLRLAVSNTDRLIRLVNDILDLEKFQQGAAPLHCGLYLADDLIEAAVASLGGLAGQSGITLQSRPAMDLAAYGDRDRLVQVLVNLLGNAIKFSPEGSAVTVLAIDAGAGRVRFSVADEGPGVPETLRPLLFEPFRQGDSSDTRVKGGTGLGLAISRSIVQQHGGWIDVDSDMGVGSTFVFEVPAPPAGSLT